MFAVGEGSAAAARALGHGAVAAEGDAQSLLALLRQRLRPADGALLLAVGEGYAADLAAGLRAAGFAVQRRLAYAARPATALPPAAVAALAAREVGAALFFSPRSAAQCLALLERAGVADAVPSIRAIAISPRVAAFLGRMRWGSVQTAARPDADAMLTALGHAD